MSTARQAAEDYAGLAREQEQRKHRKSDAESCQIISDLLRELMMVEREQSAEVERYRDLAAHADRKNDQHTIQVCINDDGSKWFLQFPNRFTESEMAETTARIFNAYRCVEDAVVMADLEKQLEIVTRERDEAREAARHYKKRIERILGISEGSEEWTWLKETT